jgi:hypothetical protein
MLAALKLPRASLHVNGAYEFDSCQPRCQRTGQIHIPAPLTFTTKTPHNNTTTKIIGITLTTRRITTEYHSQFAVGNVYYQLKKVPRFRMC